MRHKITVIFFWFFSISGAIAQTAPSPFTSVGIGEIGTNAMIQQEASGGVGIAMGSYWNLNTINPAMLMYTRNTIFGGLTVFQAGVISDNRTIRNASNSERSGGSNLSYLVTGFPVIQNRWFSTIGLRPFSSVNYNLNYETQLAGSPYTTLVTEKGSGGINQLFWSNGVALSKNLSLGLRTQVLFSSIFTEFVNNVDTQEIPVRYSAAVYDRLTVSGLTFTGGLVYTDSIKTSGDDPLKITLGLTYDFARDVRAKQFQSVQRRILTGTILEADTVQNNTVGSLDLPSGLGFGIGLSKGFKWSIGADLRMKSWEDLRRLEQPLATANSMYLGIGGEITPDAFSIEDYLKRVTFRLGGSYEKTPYLINGVQVNDFGINFGFSLPIVPSSNTGSSLNKGFSSVDFGFRYGVQGNLDNNLLQEEYFKIHFGITFNDKWFIKRRFN